MAKLPQVRIDLPACKVHPAPVGHKQINWVTLGILIFYNVSGGPFGSEAAVGAAGPLLALGGFLVMPLFWSVPSALVTAELSTAFPDDAGFVSWVTGAFGPFWGFQEGVLSWICAVTDNAIYPTLFVAYLKYVLCPVDLDDDTSVECPALDAALHPFLPSNRTVIVVITSCALTYLSWRGLDFVGKVAGGLTIFMLLPFVIICMLGLPRLDPAKWFRFGPTDEAQRVDWTTYFNVLFWNLSCWDTASTIAGEVADPSRNFPRALVCALVLVVGAYLLPMAVSIGALPEGQVWHNGFYAMAGFMLGGRLLQGSVLAAAAVSNVGQFLSEQASDAFLLAGMAELGYLPRIFTVRSKHDTPTIGLLITLVVILVLTPFEVVHLVEMLNGVYCIAALLQFAAFLELRRRYPTLPRPYKVPLSLPASTLMLAPPSLTCLFLLCLPVMERRWTTLAYLAGSSMLGPLLYTALQVLRRRAPKLFLRAPPSADEVCSARTLQVFGLPEPYALYGASRSSVEMDGTGAVSPNSNAPSADGAENDNAGTGDSSPDCQGLCDHPELQHG